MERKLYNNYLSAISYALENGQRRSPGIKGIADRQNKHFSLSATEDDLLFKSISYLSDISGRKTHYDQRPGEHPDFRHIKAQQRPENHYITSVFIDIKNSTNLFKLYMPEVVAYITQTIQRVAIHTCWYFDGYIQRYHGDGLFVYFGGKNQSKEDSVKQALKATSLFSYFVERDLVRIFNEKGVEDIYTRIGIDIGDDEDVVWHLAGMGECSEITTCSLHTSLAAKMQQNSLTNGIIVGDNVKEFSKLESSLFFIKDEKDRYIFKIPSESFYYTQWHFDWSNYLNSLPNLYFQNGILMIREEQKPLIQNSLNYNYLAERGSLIRPWGE